jgi:hypothetical protein
VNRFFKPKPPVMPTGSASVPLAPLRLGNVSARRQERTTVDFKLRRDATLAEFYAMFRECWPYLSSQWVAAQKHRWIPLADDIGRGISHHPPEDTWDKMILNWTNVWWASEIPGDPVETRKIFIDNLLANLDPRFEKARDQFLWLSGEVIAKETGQPSSAEEMVNALDAIEATRAEAAKTEND